MFLDISIVLVTIVLIVVCLLMILLVLMVGFISSARIMLTKMERLAIREGRLTESRR